MLYALNLVEVEDYDVHRRCLATAGPVVQQPRGDLAVMGEKAAEVPVRFRGTTGGRAQRKPVGARG